MEITTMTTERNLKKRLARMMDVSGEFVYYGAHVWYHNVDETRLVDGYVSGIIISENDDNLAEILPADKQDEENPTLLVMPGRLFKRI